MILLLSSVYNNGNGELFMKCLYTVWKKKLSVKREDLPALRSQIFDFHIEERQEGCAAEGTSAVEVGVVSCPASHDLFVIHQTVTRLTK